MAEEFNYKVHFAEQYLDPQLCAYDINFVDLILKDKAGKNLLYIESKNYILNDTQHRHALAQTILTNKKQIEILSRVALIYKDADNNDVLDLLDCSEDSVMHNNDINWKAEKPSNPSRDAIDRINDRLIGRIITYKNDEIKEFYSQFKKGNNSRINITTKNFNVVYHEWKNAVKFKKEVLDEQELINLFLVDLLNGTSYQYKVQSDIGLVEQNLVREGTSLSKYVIKSLDDELKEQIEYDQGTFFRFADSKAHAAFWKKYQRPPAKEEFLAILERSATLYSDEYRRDTGGEYTPTCFVEKQNEILRRHYNLDEFIVVDPCAGVGNLENQFGKDFKRYCYLSTLEQMDVDICLIKGFENVVKFDFLIDETFPRWKYKGKEMTITEIAKREHKKLMVVMNPPYQNKKGFANNLAIEFFNKVLAWEPDVIVFYYMTESFLRDEIKHYINSGYKIKSHIFSNAKTTFQLSEWPISQIIFDKENGTTITEKHISATRYELDTKSGKFKKIKKYTYNNTKPNLIDEIDTLIKQNETGAILGNVSYLRNIINLTNKPSKNTRPITTDNLKYCFLSYGINFNTHDRYFERSYMTYKGKLNQISSELWGDAITFTLFFKAVAFTNKGQTNYIMPFTSLELGCRENDLNVLFASDAQYAQKVFADTTEDFDFRQWLKQFSFSEEAKELYRAALKIFRYYHSAYEYANGRDWNDSFYDITNAIMGKTNSSFSDLKSDNDTRITKVKTTKGTKGFGRNTIKYAVPSEHLPKFIEFFDARDTLARKINKQLVEAGLLLWERENIY